MESTTLNCTELMFKHGNGAKTVINSRRNFPILKARNPRNIALKAREPIALKASRAMPALKQIANALAATFTPIAIKSEDCRLIEPLTSAKPISKT